MEQHNKEDVANHKEDFPYDERPLFKQPSRWQTEESMRAIGRAKLRREQPTPPTPVACTDTVPTCTDLRTRAVAPMHPWDSLCSWTPMPAAAPTPPSALLPWTSSPQQECLRPKTQSVGPSHWKVYRTSIASSLLPLLPAIIAKAEDHVQGLPDGWQTGLYSLTRQDLPVKDIPGGLGLVEALTANVVETLHTLYSNKAVRMDGNQPHILKYCEHHRGVELHHDRCDVTVQLMLSASSDYAGGGTRFPNLAQVVRLEQGEMLLHPGSLVHGGDEITSGKRYILVWFCHLES